MTKQNLDIYLKAVELMDTVTRNTDGSYWRVNGDYELEHNLDLIVYSEYEFIQLAKECGAEITLTVSEEKDTAVAAFHYKRLTVATYVLHYELDRFKALVRENK